MRSGIKKIRGWIIASSLMICGLLQAQTEDHVLAATFQKYLDESFAMRPFEATQLGDHRLDNMLEDVSETSRGKWLDHQKSTLARLSQSVNYSRLSSDGKVDFDIFQQSLIRSVWMAERFNPFEEDPRIYNEYINDSVFLVLAQSSLPKEKNVLNAISRMTYLPAVIQAAKKNLKNPPLVVVETAIRQNQGAINFYEKDLFTLVGRTPQMDRLKEVAGKLLPELKSYQEFLTKELKPRAGGNWRVGRDKFSKKLDMTLESGISTDELLVLAESEFARVHQELYVVARQLWGKYFSGQSLPADDPEGRLKTIALVQHKVAQEHGKPEDLVKDARATVAQIKKFIAANDILRLPDPDHCRIIEMPEFQRGNAVAYMNSPPPLDTQAAGFYAVSPPPRDWDAGRVKSLLEEYNRHMLQILTIHEAYPGHYVQHEYANRNPSLIRKVLASGVYIEGWAVYTEQTMLDQGYGQGDLALRLNQLKFYLRAVANAILDHKMHCSNMTDEEALEFLTKRALQSEGEARLKIVRSKQSSVQLSTYFAGRMAHYRLRQQIQKEMGESFNLGRYHEAVLAVGPVPVKHLPTLVREKLRGS